MLRFLLALLLLIHPLFAAAADLQDATGRTVRLPDQPARILPAGPPAAVLLAVLAPDLMVGWPHAPSPAARMWLPDATAALPTIPMLTGRQDVTGQLVALQPDFILDYGAVNPRYAQIIEAVQAKIGIPAVLLDGALPKTPRVLRALGAALHRVDRAELLCLLWSWTGRPGGQPWRRRRRSIRLARMDGTDPARKWHAEPHEHRGDPSSGP
jgi:iron complex transport system substrate-binding protein